MKFTSNKYGRESIFHTGQKVQCVYYHEYDSEHTPHYRRPWYQRIFDTAFHPVKLGVIVGDAGRHPYWLGNDGTEQYLFVKFKEYRFNKAIPISCISDAEQSAKEMKEFLAKNIDKIGQKGYSAESFASLQNQANKAENFTK